MNGDSKSTTVRSLDRINLRLAGDTFAAIDAACASRPGNVSRNTWIAEAVEEKLARERNVQASSEGERRAHG
jgi:metal-responsive CopG/Arc/MetJ family transcriptional regulator